ncbi:response regulator transcription factor [Billgrantia kenyensis]|uniref:Response regulator transcription factor n=1 Tax=Billgrantia kenyensis TaxID=321266 RepID=A0A7V9W0T0_9GAMM|nr:response regulator transcription factor [Halomonas kenyensis]MBA2778933.1 response regulator transcription factor [Halomonas kenyensis]MCG6662860.1 response regulator transcription factor [Halomonas kenyensis]
MMGNLFVSQKREVIPRLRSAFPEIRRVAPDQTHHEVARGDHVWLMTDHDAWPAVTNALAARGATPVVMSLVPSEAEALQALQAGARGYIHALSPVELLRQVALVTGNQGIWVPAELLGKVLGFSWRALSREEEGSDALSVLTEREREVALAVADGASNKEVARRLDITERTVKAHLSAVFRKLDVRDRLQLILHLTRQGAEVLDADQ